MCAVLLIGTELAQLQLPGCRGLFVLSGLSLVLPPASLLLLAGRAGAKLEVVWAESLTALGS